MRVLAWGGSDPGFSNGLRSCDSEISVGDEVKNGVLRLFLWYGNRCRVGLRKGLGSKSRASGTPVPLATLDPRKTNQEEVLTEA